MAHEYAYSANKISKWLTQQEFKHHPRSSKIDYAIYEHGICVEFASPVQSDEYVSMSIQTHPSIAGFAFAETAILISSDKMVFPASLGYYDDVLRHDEPEDLFKHIEKVAALVFDKATFYTIMALGGRPRPHGGASLDDETVHG